MSQVFGLGLVGHTVAAQRRILTGLPLQSVVRHQCSPRTDGRKGLLRAWLPRGFLSRTVTDICCGRAPASRMWLHTRFASNTPGCTDVSGAVSRWWGRVAAVSAETGRGGALIRGSSCGVNRGKEGVRLLKPADDSNEGATAFFFCGLACSGKSTLARFLETRLPAKRLSVDEHVLARHDVGVSDEELGHLARATREEFWVQGARHLRSVGHVLFD